jgi:Tol biopolymer transport system component
MQQRSKVTVVLAGILLLGQLATHGQTRTAETEFKSAQHKEEVEGDLKAAIEQYKKLSQGKDRAIAAKSLVRMAECYEKLGQTDAQKTYERVVREFADQADSANVARSRLSTLRAPGSGQATQVARMVWEIGSEGGEDPSESTPSSDGRYLGFTDWNTGDLGVHDFIAGTNHRLTNTGGWDKSADFAEASAISPDGRQIAYGWYDNKLARYELRLLPTSAADSTQPRILFKDEQTDYVSPFAWTPDGKQVLFSATRKDRSNQMVLASLQSGTTRVVKSFGPMQFPGFVKISPDGKYAAYEREPGESTARDIFVVDIQSGRETAAVQGIADDRYPLWSPDGSQLLFLSDRTGSSALWGVRMEVGQPVGNAQFIKDGMSSTFPLTLTSGGTLYYGAGGNVNNVYVADLDSSGKVSKPPTIATDRSINHNFSGSWSPDGRYLAYYARLTISSGQLIVRDVRTGEERELSLHFNIPQQIAPRWFPDGRAVMVVAREPLRDGLGYYRVDVTTGNATALHYTNTRGAGPRTPDISPDGKAIFFGDKVGTDAMALLRLDLDSGRTTELRRAATGEALHSCSVSPDGKQLVYVADTPSRASSIEMIPTSGGQPVELLRGTPDNSLQNTLTWSPDQRFVVFARRAASNKLPSDIWRISIADHKAETIGVSLPANIKSPSISPDGRRIVFRVQEASPVQVWTLENFLQKTAKR